MKKMTFSSKETAAFCREMEYLMHAGISTADALTNIADDETRPAFKECFQTMANEADMGASLSECMKKAGCFEDYIGEMIAVGEQSGKIENALDSVALSCENRARIDSGIKSALLYPSILLIIMLTVVAVLLIYVLPIFNEVYSQLGSQLTGVAGALLAVGNFLGKIFPLLIVLFIAIIVFLVLFASVDTFRERLFTSWMMKNENKGLASKLNSARFASALAMCMSSGLSPDYAVKEAAKVIISSNGAAPKTDKCSQLMDEGSSVSAALRESGLLPASQCRLLEAGIRGGNSESAIASIAERLTEEGNAALEETISKVEPVMVVITSVLVGLILISVMLPLINIMAAIG